MLRLYFLLIILGAVAAYETNCALNHPPDTLGWLSCNGGTCSIDQVATLRTQSHNILLYNQHRHLVSIPNNPGFYLQTSAAASLKQIVTQNEAKFGLLKLNGALRSAVEYHVIHQWHLKGLCGITSLDDVNESMAGLTVNIGSPKYAGALQEAGWWRLTDTYYAYPAADVPPAQMRSQSIKTFQALYNQNRSARLIPVTGEYDEITGMALDSVPITGFSEIQCLLF